MCDNMLKKDLMLTIDENEVNNYSADSGNKLLSYLTNLSNNIVEYFGSNLNNDYNNTIICIVYNNQKVIIKIDNEKNIVIQINDINETIKR